ncbi:MAG: hypothetical protein ACWA41_00685 [Putridiphycobacter sp.]
MKIKLSVLFLLFFTIIFAQDYTAFSDANRKLYLFNKGLVYQIETQQTKDLQIGNHYVAYGNMRNDYFVVWEGVKKQIAQGQTQFYETDNILVATYTSILKVFDHGEEKNLTAYYMNFGYGDSLVVFQDRIGGDLKYYYQDTVVEFAQVIGDYLIDPNQIGNNVFAYGDVAGNYYAFANHKFYPLMSSNVKPTFAAGLNVIAYNHPINNTFNVFKDGEIIELDYQAALAYAAGDNFVYYKDQSETEYVYFEGEKLDLGYGLEEVEVHDSIVTYYNSNYLNIWFKGDTYSIYNTNNIENYQVDGGIVAYLNNRGGVSAFVRGEELDITNQKVQNFWLNGNTIVLQYGPSAFGVWWNGKIINF